MIKKSSILVSSVVLLILGTVSFAYANSPTEAVRETVDAVIETLNNKALSDASRKQERRDKMRNIINQRFDYREMSKRSLAKHWKKRSKDERNEFVDIFSQLLEASYIGKIEAYTDEKINYGKEKIKGKGKYALVRTTVITKSVDIPIDYKVILKKGKWWVYDVIVEGVSFISTYRSQYNRIIKKESYSGLLKNMKDKLKEVNSSEKKEGSS